MVEGLESGGEFLVGVGEGVGWAGELKRLPLSLKHHSDAHFGRWEEEQGRTLKAAFGSCGMAEAAPLICSSISRAWSAAAPDTQLTHHTPTHQGNPPFSSPRTSV